MKIFDISPMISEKIAVFPGDHAFARKQSCSIKSGDNIDLSSITSTLHLGSHADAPSHYGDAETIEFAKLERYLGKAQVVQVSLKAGERILPEHLKAPIQASRVLFRTDSFLDPNQWVDDFNSLSPELIEFLHNHKVELVGIDTPSVDPAASRVLEAHKMILQKNLSILEGLVLKDVEAGLYQLIALPLKLEGAEASPLRAILLEMKDDIRNH